LAHVIAFVIGPVYTHDVAESFVGDLAQIHAVTLIRVDGRAPTAG